MGSKSLGERCGCRARGLSRKVYMDVGVFFDEVVSHVVVDAFDSAELLNFMSVCCLILDIKVSVSLSVRLRILPSVTDGGWKQASSRTDGFAKGSSDVARAVAAASFRLRTV